MTIAKKLVYALALVALLSTGVTSAHAQDAGEYQVTVTVNDEARRSFLADKDLDNPFTLGPGDAPGTVQLSGCLVEPGTARNLCFESISVTNVASVGSVADGFASGSLGETSGESGIIWSLTRAVARFNGSKITMTGFATQRSFTCTGSACARVNPVSITVSVEDTTALP